MGRAIGPVRVASLAILLSLALSCSRPDGAGSEEAPRGRPSSTASLAVDSPANGSVFDGPTVPVRISLEGGRVVSKTSTQLVPDEGHLHLFLDERLVEMNYSLEGELTDVEPGTHTLRVEFVALDHAPFDPRVFAEVVFEVGE